MAHRGQARTATGAELRLCRLKASDLTFDLTFGSGGCAAYSYLTIPLWAVALSPAGDGGWLVAGQLDWGGGDSEFFVVKFASGGALDSTFSALDAFHPGMAVVPVDLVAGGYDVARALAVDRLGRVLVAGDAPAPTVSHAGVVVRLTASGILETRTLDKTGTPIRRAALTGVLAALAFGAPASAIADGNRACGLLTAAELGAVVGGKLSGLQAGSGSSPLGVGSQGGSDAMFSSAQTPNASILLRVAKKTGRAPDSAAKGVAIAKQMGAQVEVKTFGPITCSSMVPPKGLGKYGFNTTCSLSTQTQVAAVEVTAKSQRDMVPIDKLRPLAEKMAGRF